MAAGLDVVQNMKRAKDELNNLKDRQVSKSTIFVKCTVTGSHDRSKQCYDFQLVKSSALVELSEITVKVCARLILQ